MHYTCHHSFYFLHISGLVVASTAVNYPCCHQGPPPSPSSQVYGSTNVDQLLLSFLVLIIRPVSSISISALFVDYLCWKVPSASPVQLLVISTSCFPYVDHSIRFLPMWTFCCIYSSLMGSKCSCKLPLCNQTTGVHFPELFNWIIISMICGNDKMLHKLVSVWRAWDGCLYS